MNQRRLSYGLLAILAAAFVGGCGDDTPPATPAQPSATAEAAPAPTQAEPAPAPTQTAEPTPPPPPPKQAKDKFSGKFNQDFSGEVKDAADAAAKRAAGAKDKDGTKYNKAMEKAATAFQTQGSVIDVTSDTLTWSLKGKTIHTIAYKIDKGDENTLALKLGKDGKKDLKGLDVAITFKDDNTFEMKDPFAKKPMVLVFKK